MSVSVRLHGLRARRSNVGAATALGRHRIHLNHFISQEQNGPDTAARAAGRFTLAVKDNIATRSLPTTCASAILAGYVSPYEATVVTQLRGLGAHVVGKTNLDEFGMGSHNTNSVAGPVLNAAAAAAPHAGDPTPRSAGGSSGGSAVAVAVGDADVALGTDTGGSVRLPAAYNAVVGFKPSYGMLSRRGVVPYANSLDTVGLLARSVRRVRRLVAGLWRHHDPLDPTSIPPATRLRCACAREGYADADAGADARIDASPRPWSDLTFGVPLEYNIDELDPAIRAGWAAAASLLQALGARVVPVSLPSTRHALSAYYVLAPAEASSNLAKYDGVRYGNGGPDADRQKKGEEYGYDDDDDDGYGGVLYAGARGAGFGDEVRRRILLGSYSLSSQAMDNYFVQAQRVRRLVRADFDRAFRLENPLLDHGDTAAAAASGIGFELDPEAAAAAADVVDLADLPEDVPLADKRGPARVDFLLCPTAPTPPPTLDEAVRQTSLDSCMNDVFTVPASLAGLPAINIPLRLGSGGDGRGDGDLDVSRYGGLQLTGQYWDDARLLDVAAALRVELGKAGMDPRAAQDEGLEVCGDGS